MLHVLKYRLSREHEWLERQIAQESRRPSPDFLLLQSLKRKKLTMKERLVALERNDPKVA